MASILIMDDEDDVTQVMQKGLKMAGFEVDTKCNPPDALAGFKAGVHDMVLLDVKMPQMDDSSSQSAS